MTLGRLLYTFCALAITLCACGGDAKRTSGATADSANGAPSPDTSVAPASSPAVPGQTPLTVADIDRWEKGMAAELAAVRNASAKIKEAKTGEDSLSAMMGVQETATAEAGAKAAGVDVERYKVIQSTLSSAASYLAPWIGGVDTTMLTPDMREELKKGNAEQLEQMKGMLPADVVGALTPRAPDLRKKNLELTAARLKGVGA